MKHIWCLLKQKIGEQSFKTRASVFVVLGLIILAIVVPGEVFAEGATAATSETQNLEWMDTIFLLLAKMILVFTNFLGKLIALITEVVMVNVMTYNGFGSSPVIGAGWAIVRDLMNMGFVVVLLIIAMVTIFGGKAGSWTVKWLPETIKLLIFAILINFSRTICVFLIDIGQVFMLTFANAIKDIAGGNFLQLFGLSDFMQLDPQALTTLVQQNQGLDAFNLLMAAMLALLMSLAVFGTMLILTVILVYRIVTLWVLVVLSPIAFFFGGAGVLSSGAGNPYADWWKRFTGAVAIGPVLVFFLWLTLSVAGSGNIAATESFPVGAPSEALGEFGNANHFVTKIAEPGRLLSFIIGMGMLYAGFEVAQSFATSLPGQAQKLVKGGVKGAMALGAGTTIGAGLAAGKMGGRAGMWTGGKALKGGKYVGGAALKKIGQTQTAQDIRGQIGQGLVAKGGAMGGILGGGLARVGTSLEQARRKDAASRLGEAGKDVANMNMDELRAGLAGKAVTPDGIMRQQAMRQRILTSKFLRKEMDPNELSGMYQDFVDNDGKNTVKGDSKMAQDFAAMEKARPDLIADNTKQSELLSQMSDQEIMAADSESFRDPRIRAELKNRRRFEHRAKEVVGADGKKRWESGYVDFETLLTEGKMGTREQQSVIRDMNKEGGGAEVNTKTISDKGIRELPAGKQSSATQQALIDAGKIEVLMENPDFQIQNLPLDYIKDGASEIVQNAAPEKVRELAMSERGDEFKEGIKEALATRSFEMGASDAFDSQRMEMDLKVALVSSSQGATGLEASGVGYNAETNKFDGDGEKVFIEALRRDPGMISNFKEDLKGDGDISKAAFENMDLTKTLSAYRNAEGGEQDDLRQVLDTYSEKLNTDIEAARTRADAAGADNKREQGRENRTADKLSKELRRVLNALSS